jgi:hypothetical protein
VRSNLSWSGPVLWNRLNASFDATYSLNTQQQSFVDRNFAGVQRFALENEGSRPVFVNVSSIVPLTGGIAAGDGRVVPQYQRVTEQLDSFERQLRTLRGLADFSRISLDFVPREAFANAATGPDVTGFGWIGALSPFRRDVGADGKRIALSVPEGLVVLSPKGAYVAESPEGAAIWTGTLPNDPRADAAFWIAAVHERLGDDFAKAETRAVGTWQCLTLTDGGEAPYVWEVCVQVDAADKTLWLGEVYYPSVEAQQRYAPAIAAALTGGAS